MVETVIPNFCTIDLRTSSDTIGGIIAVLSYWKKLRRERGDFDEEDARMVNGEGERKRGRGGREREREREIFTNRQRQRESVIERGKGEYGLVFPAG